MTSTTTIVGNLTRDPELRFTPSGQATASFGVAVNRRWQNRQSQEWEEATSFFDVVVWTWSSAVMTMARPRSHRMPIDLV